MLSFSPVVLPKPNPSFIGLKIKQITFIANSFQNTTQTAIQCLKTVNTNTTKEKEKEISENNKQNQGNENENLNCRIYSSTDRGLIQKKNKNYK